jgi:hypothetical protein
MIEQIKKKKEKSDSIIDFRYFSTIDRCQSIVTKSLPWKVIVLLVSMPSLCSVLHALPDHKFLSFLCFVHGFAFGNRQLRLVPAGFGFGRGFASIALASTRIKRRRRPQMSRCRSRHLSKREELVLTKCLVHTNTTDNMTHNASKNKHGGTSEAGEHCQIYR